MCVGARYKQNIATEAIAMYLCPDGGSRDGDPDWARTSSLQLRRLTLYPTELRGHNAVLIIALAWCGVKRFAAPMSFDSWAQRFIRVGKRVFCRAAQGWLRVRRTGPHARARLG